MINNKRIVPVMKTDLLTLISVIMALVGMTVTAIAADTVGVFSVDSGSGNMLASEPVKTLNFGQAVTAAVVYFIPDYHYEGFTIDGAATETAGEDVDPDGTTLYKATLASGAVTIAKVGF